MLDAPCHDGGGGVIYHCKTHLNIDIYPCTLFFFLKILAISMILREGGVVSGSGWGGEGWLSSKETNLFYQINSYLLTM